MPELPNNDKALLTRREQEIITFAAAGIPNKQIAARLNVSAETVKKHLQNVFAKLEVHNKIEALNKLGI